MAVSMSSKSKLTFVNNVVTAISEARAKISQAVDEIKSVSDSAQYAAVDRVYNAVADLSTQFSDVTCNKTKKVLLEIAEQLCKRNDIGTAFVMSAKRAQSNVESIPSPQSWEPIKTERDGDEVWNPAMATRLESAIDSWSKARRQYIESLSEAFGTIAEEEFKTSVKPIGQANEEFTNSTVTTINSIGDALSELNIDIGKFQASVSESASSSGIETANVKVDLRGADF